MPRQDRANFGTESYLLPGDSIIDEFNAHGVARHHQPFLSHIPDSESEHAVEMIEDISPPLPIAVHNYLGVTVGPKTISQLFKFHSQFFEIVDFAIENDPDCLFGVGHWLMASGKVNDGKATKPQADWTGNKITFVVRAAMSNGIRHSPDYLRIDRCVIGEIKLTADAAHST